MLKSNRREAMIFLLGGLAALGGSNLTTGKHASLPEGCRWLELPYNFENAFRVLEQLAASERLSLTQAIPEDHQSLIWELIRSAAQRELYFDPDMSGEVEDFQ